MSICEENGKCQFQKEGGNKCAESTCLYVDNATTPKTRWHRASFSIDYLVAEDGEILEEVSYSSFYNSYTVQSTGKRYLQVEQARTAAEKHYYGKNN